VLAAFVSATCMKWNDHEKTQAAMTIADGTAIVLAYVLVSMGVIVAFLLGVFVIGWFIGRLRQRRRGNCGEE
jgi:hypothetical protein